MSYQDWKPVIIRKSPAKKVITKPDQPIKKYNAGKNSNQQNVNSKKIEQNADNGDEKLELPKVNHNLRIEIQQARTKKGLTQKQLANACQLPESVIRTYENGTAIPNSNYLEKMSHVLGVTLRNK
jgi:putative transcription factor